MYPQNPVLSVGDSINFTVSNQGFSLVTIVQSVCSIWMII